MVLSSGAVRPGAYTKPFELGSKIVAHTISKLGNDIITWEVRIPKWMVAEFNTHKIEIERNSASSRAVPSKLIIEMVQEYPCMPYQWKYNASGMSPQELMSPEDEDYSNNVWLESRDLMIAQIEKLQKLPSGRSADKQRANRLLEFCMGTVVVCTMTGGGGIGINNFFGLRDKPEAQPEFEYVAHMMHNQYHDSIPNERSWHLPYVEYTDKFELPEHWGDDELAEWTARSTKAAIVSSARCGRVTHYKQGEIRSIEEDVKRGQSFADYGHFSPLRHASRAGDNRWYGNMYGWNPISKIMLEGKDYVQACCERSPQYVHSGDNTVAPI